MKDDKQNDRQGVALSERMAFEAYLRERLDESTIDEFVHLLPHGEYAHWQIELAWEIWQARASSSRAEVEKACTRCREYRDATGERVVPVCRCKIAAAEAPNGDQS